MKHNYFLVSGFGVQGGSVKDIVRKQATDMQQQVYTELKNHCGSMEYL